jgi:hypothetical protein
MSQRMLVAQLHGVAEQNRSSEYFTLLVSSESQHRPQNEPLLRGATPITRVSRPRFMAARRWATLHPCDCGGRFTQETFFQASRLIKFTCNRCGQTILVPYEDAGVL